MARTKKLIAEENEGLECDTLELSIYTPTLSEDSVMQINGNFSTVKENIVSLVDRYKGTVLTDDNVDYVKALKAKFTSLRTSIERARTDYRKIYIDPAEKTLNAYCSELQAVVAEGENALKAQLEAYDQKRKDELTVILKEYAEESANKHGLREEYASRIQLKDKYYNKTQDEEDSADDIEEQAVALEKEQKNYDDGVALIKGECEGTVLIVENYIRELQYKSAVEIILEVKRDKKKAEELYSEMKAKEEAGEKIVIGEPVKLKGTTEIASEEKRERTLWIKYTPSQAQKLKEFFIAEGIEYRFM